MAMVGCGITRVKRKLSRGVKIITSYFIPLLVGHVPLEEGMEVDPVKVTSTAPSYRGGSRDSPNSRSRRFIIAKSYFKVRRSFRVS